MQARSRTIIESDGKQFLTFEGGVDGDACDLLLALPDGNSLGAAWSNQDVAMYDLGQREPDLGNSAILFTLYENDSQGSLVSYEDGKLIGDDADWKLADKTADAWAAVFAAVHLDAGKDRDFNLPAFNNWMTCTGGHAAVGGAIGGVVGGAVGFIHGGPGPAAVGAGIGGVIGAGIGAGVGMPMCLAQYGPREMKQVSAEEVRSVAFAQPRPLLVMSGENSKQQDREEVAIQTRSRTVVEADGETFVTFEGGADGDHCDLLVELTDGNSLHAKWSNKDVAAYDSDPENRDIPITIVENGSQEHNVNYKGGKLFDGDAEWKPSDAFAERWASVFTPGVFSGVPTYANLPAPKSFPADSPYFQAYLQGTKDFPSIPTMNNTMGCVGGYAAVAGAIGGVAGAGVGFTHGGPPVAAAAGAVGTVIGAGIGASIGTYMCTRPSVFGRAIELRAEASEEGSKELTFAQPIFLPSADEST